ncbi:hypothetical protein JCM10213_004756 [Rhodosporidiobolus nylandii]
METPYPPQPLPSSTANASSSSSASSSPVASVDTAPTPSEPRHSRKRSVRDKEQDGPLASQEEAFAGEEGGEVDARAARPRVIGRARAGSARGELARRAAARDKGSEERGWMARSASEGGEVVNAGGASDDYRPQVKRRRVDLDEGIEQQGAASPANARKEFSHPRPARLQVVPSYQDSLLTAARSPLLPSSLLSAPHTPDRRQMPIPSTSQPPFASPVAPPPTASTSSAPFALPLTPATPFPTSRTVSSPCTPSRPRARRRANSLPTPSTRTYHSAQPFLHPSPASRASPYQQHYAYAQAGRKHKLYDSRQRGRAVSPPAFPISQAELLAVHAARLSRVEGSATTPLSPTALVPPISSATLQELDMNQIMRNPQLRHDVVFDPNLMFRPNYDGERGERKRVAAEQYWSAVNREITFGCRCTTFRSGAPLPCVCLPADAPARPTPPPTSLSSRLPSRIIPLIIELRNVLLTLLPTPTDPASPPTASTPTFGSAYSPPSPYPASPASPTTLSAARNQILEVLEPSYLAQQLARGVLDVPALAAFLGRTLKCHCAPMRDALVDEMVRACEGEGLANGLRQCFEILELMKLDIANHQLRSLRPYLVESAVTFERRFFQDIATNASRRNGVSSLEHIREWLSSGTSTACVKDLPRSMKGVDKAVVDGLLKLVFAPSPSSTAPTASLPALSTLPETLQLDSYRLQAFHSDAVDLTVIYQLLLLFQQLAFPARPSLTDLDSLRKELWCIMLSSTGAASTLVGPGASVQGIPQGSPGAGVGKLNTPAWRAGMKDVLLQVAARAKELQLRAASEMAGVSSSASSPSQLPPMPDAKTLALVASYFDTNVKPDSKLFQLLSGRVRDTVRAVVEEELAKEQAQGPMGFASWWAPAVEPATMATGGAYPATSGSGGVRPEASMMASTTPVKRGKKRLSVDLDAEEASSDDEGEKRQRTGRSSSISTRTGLPLAPSSAAPASPVDVALARNGLTALSSEVRLLGQRIAKVASFNLTVHRSFFEALLAAPSPASSA